MRTLPARRVAHTDLFRPPRQFSPIAAGVASPAPILSSPSDDHGGVWRFLRPLFKHVSVCTGIAYKIRDHHSTQNWARISRLPLESADSELRRSCGGCKCAMCARYRQWSKSQLFDDFAILARIQRVWRAYSRLSPTTMPACAYFAMCATAVRGALKFTGLTWRRGHSTDLCALNPALALDPTDSQ